MERRNIKTLHELAEEGYDLIINCSGLGARELVADKTITSIRGQVYRVIDLPITLQHISLFSSRSKIVTELSLLKLRYRLLKLQQ